MVDPLDWLPLLCASIDVLTWSITIINDDNVHIDTISNEKKSQGSSNKDFIGKKSIEFDQYIEEIRW